MLEIFRTLNSFIPICLLAHTCKCDFSLLLPGWPERCASSARSGVGTDGGRARTHRSQQDLVSHHSHARERTVKKTCGLIDILLTVDTEGRSVIQRFPLVLTAVTHHLNEVCHGAAFASHQPKCSFSQSNNN